MTGESVPVDEVLGNQIQVMSGSLRVRGEGGLEITRTGVQSAMGELAASVARPGARPRRRDRAESYVDTEPLSLRVFEP